MGTYCDHDGKKRFIDWPDGGQVEVCGICGKSRHHWEQGESKWKIVPNIEAAKKELEKAIEKL